MIHNCECTTKSVRPIVRATPQVANKLNKVPKGAEDLLADFLQCAGYGGVFEIRMTPGKTPGSPGRQGKVFVCSDTYARSIAVTCQPGGNDSSRQYLIPTPKGVEVRRFHEVLRNRADAFNTHNHRAKAEEEDTAMHAPDTPPEPNTSSADPAGKSAAPAHALRNVADDEVLLGLFLASLIRTRGAQMIPQPAVAVCEDAASGLTQYNPKQLGQAVTACQHHGFLKPIFGRGETKHKKGYLVTAQGREFVARLEAAQYEEAQARPVQAAPPEHAMPAELQRGIEPYRPLLEEMDTLQSQDARLLDENEEDARIVSEAHKRIAARREKIANSRARQEAIARELAEDPRATKALRAYELYRQSQEKLREMEALLKED